MKNTSIFFLLLIVLIFKIFSLSAQETNPSKFGVKLSGFINAYFIADSRQSWNSRECSVMLYPKNILKDPDGKDINGNAIFDQYAMNSRLTATFTAPDAFGAKVSGVIESDFTGSTNNGLNQLRLRHAYVKFNWPHSELLAGQYWHPFEVNEISPDVIAVNAGAPFHPHARYPQVRYTQTFGKIDIIGTAISQRDNADSGPSDVSSNYMMNSAIPSLDLQLQYKSDALFYGIGGDFKRIVPRLETLKGYKADESLNSFSGIAFIQIKTANYFYRLQGLYGGNLFDRLLPGGYGVTTIDPITDRREYANINYLTVWGQISKRTGRIQPALFVGLAKNEGSNKTINPDNTYGRALDVDYLYRISPQVLFISNKVVLGIETEYTAAAYGKPDAKYKVKDGNDIGLFRLTGSVRYYF